MAAIAGSGGQGCWLNKGRTGREVAIFAFPGHGPRRKHRPPPYI